MRRCHLGFEKIAAWATSRKWFAVWATSWWMGCTLGSWIVWIQMPTARTQRTTWQVRSVTKWDKLVTECSGQKCAPGVGYWEQEREVTSLLRTRESHEKSHESIGRNNWWKTPTSKLPTGTPHLSIYMFVDIETGQRNDVVLLYDMIVECFAEGRDWVLWRGLVYYILCSLNVLQSNVWISSFYMYSTLWWYDSAQWLKHNVVIMSHTKRMLLLTFSPPPPSRNHIMLILQQCLH